METANRAWRSCPRTDLASEARELWRERQGEAQETLPAGVETETQTLSGCRLEQLRITDDRGADALGKPCGQYLTLFPEAFLRREENAFEQTAALLGRCLKRLLPPLGEGSTILVAGLGNAAITPDELGPRTMRHVLATRHLVDALPQQFGSFRRVCAVETGVIGNTGVESAELLHALVKTVQPAAVVTVDALASRRLCNVCRTVQLTDTGITPGSGVGNARAELNRHTLQVPVVAIGVPTVVDAGTLAADLTGMASLGTPEPSDFGAYGQTMIVTPREIDAQIAELSRLLGYGIDLALHDGLTVEDVTALIG